MDTSRSGKMVKDFLAMNRPFERKEQTYRQTINAPAQAVYKQLCPSREADWIEGWTADLVYTGTGYMEQDCVFTTPETNITGPGVWVVTRVEADHLLDIVRTVGNDMVERITIALKDNGDGTTTVTWALKYTATSDQGNQMIRDMPDHDPGFVKTIKGLEHFLQTGKMLKLGGH